MHPCGEKCKCTTCLKRRIKTCTECSSCGSGEYTGNCKGYVHDEIQFKGVANIQMPIYYHMSTSGKTYYASFGIMHMNIKGESKISYEDALMDLQNKIIDSHKDHFIVTDLK